MQVHKRLDFTLMKRIFDLLCKAAHDTSANACSAFVRRRLALSSATVAVRISFEETRIKCFSDLMVHKLVKVLF